MRSRRCGVGGGRGGHSLMGTLQMTWQPSLLKSSNRKHGAPPLGLRNLGNSCYLNSVLQCFTYTPPLANFCLRFLHSSKCDLGAANEKKGESVLDAPSKINSCLRIYAEHFRTGRQEDVHDFLRYVIDACHNTCLRLKGCCQDCRNSCKEIFGGTLQSQVKCLSCGAESNNVDGIMDIKALQKFFNLEVLDGNNKYKWIRIGGSKEQMSILQALIVLVIQLKRFEGMLGGKVDEPIAFDKILVLSSYMCKASQMRLHVITFIRICKLYLLAGCTSWYNLFGTIVHSGFSPDSGLYYAYIKDAIGRWYCCNDSYVSMSTLQEVLSEKVYILFFSRAKQRPRAKVDLMVNGSISHESNGSKTSLIQKSGPEKPVCTRQVSNHQPETKNSTQSLSPMALIHSYIKLIFASNTKTNHTTIHIHWLYTATIERSDHIETPLSMNQGLDEPAKTKTSTTSLGFNCCNLTGLQNSGFLVEPVNIKQSSDHHGLTSNSAKSKVDGQVSGIQKKLAVSGSTNKLLASGNIKISVYKRESREETGDRSMGYFSGKIESSK
ncbi:hypothetical protein Pfo_022642 [Paulownia fortunei]|nr:hypothetical protein Pfo_022642 [Paulownia fortunei]